MIQLTFKIPGEPAGLRRHRTRAQQMGSRVVFRQYDPPANVANKATIAQHAVLAMRSAGASMFTGPVGLRVVARFVRPKSHFGTGRNAGTLRIAAPTIHAQKPDCDNLLKLVCDALNGVAWRDDAQVATVQVRKHWSTDGGETEIEVWEMPQDAPSPAAKMPSKAPARPVEGKTKGQKGISA